MVKALKTNVTTAAVPIQSITLTDLESAQDTPIQAKILGFKIKPRPAAYADGKESPEYRANIFSRAFFSWISPILMVGYSRPLEVEDFWELSEDYQATVLADNLEKRFYDRVPPSQRSHRYRPVSESSVDNTPKDIDASAESKDKDAEIELTDVLSSMSKHNGRETSASTGVKKTKKEPEKEAKHPKKITENGKVYDRNLIWALYHTMKWRFWLAGVFGVISTTLSATSPLVSRLILQYISASYAYSHRGADSDVPPPKPIGYGVGIVFALWAMRQVGSMCDYHCFQRGLLTGFMMRGSLIGVISRKSLRLSGQARNQHPNGNLITYISTDASFMDYVAVLLHDLYLQPLQIVVGLGILIYTIGYSALVGLGVLLIGLPFQAWLFRQLMKVREASMEFVDSRVRLLQEVLQGIRVIKFMSYESYFESRIKGIRRKELDKLKINAFMRAVLMAMMNIVPVFAAVLSFITYSLSGHQLDTATIFSALQAFNNIQLPLWILPMALQAVTDAYVGVGRISKCLLAEEIQNPVPVIPGAEYSISAHGSYCWETVEKPSKAENEALKSKPQRVGKKNKNDKNKKGGNVEGEFPIELQGPSPLPFSLKDIDLDIPRGSFVVVCGRVGSGKSSLMQALLGEMKRVSGRAYLGGSCAYFPQTPWILNATLKENILFGAEMDDNRFAAAIKTCALESDIAMLTHGVYTEIGEKGINLSGGQKARVCLARAVYSGNDINFFDDPFLSSMYNSMFVIVFQVLPKADLIIAMEDGKIAEKGTYQELLAADGALAKLMADHMSQTSHNSMIDGGDVIENQEDVELKTVKIKIGQTAKQNQPAGVLNTGQTNEGSVAEQAKALNPGALLTVKEEREIGAVSWSVYTRYIQSMGSVWFPIVFMSCMMLAQAASVATTVFLGIWSESSINGWKQGQYMAVYASLGLANALFTFAGTLLVYFAGIATSYNLFNKAYNGVLAAPVTWFDSTPTGRIISRLSKDVSTLDNQLPRDWVNVLTMGLTMLGTIALVFYSFPYLGLIFIPMLFLYYTAANFYRASSREVKRLDSIMRSTIYAQFGESLDGISSIRAYHSEDRFTSRTEKAINTENKCYFIQINLICWLSARLDILGNLLVLAISFFGIAFRNSTSPAKLGVVLTYTLAVTQLFTEIVNAFAMLEQDMNTAERVGHYADLPPEAARLTASDPSETWPSTGEIKFRDVVLKYRDNLPAVLKGLSFTIYGGEKIGVVGRTGAGKSSLLQALFRIVELSEGRIEIDGVNLRSIGLEPIRKKLGIVPQDPLLWNGTVASNLDPDGMCTPEQLLSALKRTHLVAGPDASPEVHARLEKFKLDAMVQDEGANFSAGERQLIALARVVVRDSKIVILDEATSSVDVETDANIQDTIRNEFSDKTIISIAHRLATIAFYDRILVMDAGQVVEFAPPLELFDREDSIFRSMCDQAQITRSDILRIRGEVAHV
ncbi:Multidrug resistance-associated protein/mitoxantrone resistance protein, ABC superfamily [Phaffia rhodozyma]|uniref:Multidrug resistance-associated protein/mitoxantrone resistance protein, ABC superfamily n=1 Tax=Phaffia rhodozyma TaxID=264483 RepID=A0A0F7SJF1_PHARH|nr:Multidrug resistance-associated protein/mitoxantrone resistance protein, ABC superfamily [Phaffia rhodozyma]